MNDTPNSPAPPDTATLLCVGLVSREAYLPDEDQFEEYAFVGGDLTLVSAATKWLADQKRPAMVAIAVSGSQTVSFLSDRWFQQDMLAELDRRIRAQARIEFPKDGW